MLGVDLSCEHLEYGPDEFMFSVGDAIRFQTNGAEGFAVVDALVAMGILSVAVGLSITSLAVASRIETAASSSAEARMILVRLMTEPSRPPGLYSGMSGLYSWSLSVTEDSSTPREIHICMQRATVRSSQTGKRYELQSRRFCPPASPAS